MQFIDAEHERQVRVAGFLRPVVDRRTRQRQDLALSADRQYVMTVRLVLLVILAPEMRPSGRDYEARLPLTRLSEFPGPPLASPLYCLVAGNKYYSPVTNIICHVMVIDTDVLSAFAGPLSAGYFYVDRPLSGVVYGRFKSI